MNFLVEISEKTIIDSIPWPKTWSYDFNFGLNNSLVIGKIWLYFPKKILENSIFKFFLQSPEFPMLKYKKK